MMSPTSRTLAMYRDDGIPIGVVERWLPFHGTESGDKKPGGVRSDLFGFIDLVALVDDRIVAIQACAASGLANRCTKIREQCRDNATAWVAAGGLIVVIGWKKYAKASDRKYWRPKIVDMTDEFKSITCNHCGSTNTHDVQPMGQPGGVAVGCWDCGKVVS